MNMHVRFESHCTICTRIRPHFLFAGSHECLYFMLTKFDLKLRDMLERLFKDLVLLKMSKMADFVLAALMDVLGNLSVFKQTWMPLHFGAC